MLDKQRAGTCFPRKPSGRTHFSAVCIGNHRCFRSTENALVSGIAFQKDQIKFTLHGVGDIPGTAFKILGPISDAEIEVDVIVQNVSVDGKTDFTFTVSSEDQETVIRVLESIKKEVDYRELIVDSNIAKVSLVGVGMRSQAGVASKAFKALSENNVNIH